MRIFAANLERDQQKWAPVLRPIAVLNIQSAHDSSPNRSHPRVKPEGMLWRIMRWFRDYDMRLGFAAIALL
jgi:hypothetical protein